ncbi:MAG: carbonic anhydrase [Nitrospirae bacterium]|nr:carbonic anhydrase [Nitrospirota bacterium]
MVKNEINTILKINKLFPRLLLLTAYCLLLTFGIAFADAQKSDGTPIKLNSYEALSKLLDGNKRFASGRHVQSKNLKQHPWAIVVACSDSMVAPEIIFDQGPGSIFAIRTAGNVLDPISVGSIEYAAKRLHTPLLIILGHDKCDVVKAAVETKEISQDNIMALVRKIVPAVKKAAAMGGSKEDILHNAIRENILIQRKYLLRKSPVVNNLVGAGAIQIVTGIYNDESGEVEIIKQ